MLRVTESHTSLYGRTAFNHNIYIGQEVKNHTHLSMVEQRLTTIYIYIGQGVKNHTHMCFMP